jgi:FAD:protein FMN transferase
LSQQIESTSIPFEAIGTVWNIEIFQMLSADGTARLKAKVMRRVETFDKNYSRFRKDSLVTKMARHAGRYELPADARPLLGLYQSLYEHTAGAVTPLIGSTLSAAGYDAEYSLKPGKVSAPDSWDEALEYNFPTLTLKKPSLLDFGAAGKGYLVDIISGLLADEGLERFCVNAGGDIVYRTSDGQKLEIALEHPSDPTRAIGIARIHNQSLCGSAGNRRVWGTQDSGKVGGTDAGTYHHIINPHTLASPRHIQALWVTAETGLLADGLTTALFFTDAVSLQKHYTFEYAIVWADDSLEYSAHFPATFFTNQDIT